MRILKHSLVILPGAHTSECLTWSLSHFPSHEILDTLSVRLEITGHTQTPVNKYLVKDEVVRRVHLRLSLGQRVVLIWDPTLTLDLNAWADVCDAHMAHMYVITSDAKISCARAQVCEASQVQFDHVPITQVLAVGDVHGDHAAMQLVIHHAQTHGLHVVWLGDVVDYGNHNLKCLHEVYQMVRSGQAHMIWGNHEKKISRWLDAEYGAHYRGRLSEANWKTISEIEQLDARRKRRFRSAWKFLEAASVQVLQLGDWQFTHGALHADVTPGTHHRLQGVSSDWAYYGEVQAGGIPRDGYPHRLWNWVDQLPAHAKVVVGHDWVNRDSCDITIKTGSSGGQVWCMDTGSSKGGHLSALQIDLTTNEWRSRVFKP
jgi:hypothetical protein